MLSAIAKEHQQQAAATKSKADQAQQRLQESLKELSKSAAESFKIKLEGVADTQTELEAQSKALQAQTARIAKQTQQWSSSLNQFNNALKELGDFQTWSAAIEKDMNTVSDALEFAASVDKLTAQ